MVVLVVVRGNRCEAYYTRLYVASCVQSNMLKRCLKSSKHIYDALFVNGEGSDISICALGRTWKLHKVMLRQCGYFRSMFGGQWKECDEKQIHIDIPDDNIDEEALAITFGSFYQDEVSITRKNVVGILAAATLFGLDDLISECESMMNDNIVTQTVCAYHAAGLMYGQPTLVQSCVNWLQNTLLPLQTAELLQNISMELMSTLVSSGDLLVIQIETDVYSMLRKWMFLKLLSTPWLGDIQALTRDTDNFIKSKAAEWGNSPEQCFLKLSEGSQFIDVFRQLRLQHIVMEYNSLLVVEADRIIPHEWLLEAYRLQWLSMLQVDSGADVGPKEVNEDEFLKQSCRCGRVIPSVGEYCWRWTGFNFGFDLLVSFSRRGAISLKRNVISRRTHGAVSQTAERCLMYRVTLSSLHQCSRPQFIQSTGVKSLLLRKDQEAVILTVDRSVKYPLHIGCNLLLYTPASAASVHPPCASVNADYV